MSSGTHKSAVFICLEMSHDMMADEVVHAHPGLVASYCVLGENEPVAGNWESKN